MRPQTLDQMIGQEHLLKPGKPLYQIITKQIPISLLLWGPPGCGKTTFAHVMSKTLQVPFKYIYQRPFANRPDQTIFDHNFKKKETNS